MYWSTVWQNGIGWRVYPADLCYLRTNWNWFFPWHRSLFDAPNRSNTGRYQMLVRLGSANAYQGVLAQIDQLHRFLWNALCTVPIQVAFSVQARLIIVRQSDNKWNGVPSFSAHRRGFLFLTCSTTKVNCSCSVLCKENYSDAGCNAQTKSPVLGFVTNRGLPCPTRLIIKKPSPSDSTHFIQLTAAKIWVESVPWKLLSQPHVRPRSRMRFRVPKYIYSQPISAAWWSVKWSINCIKG